jgi:hypothetical protein
MNECMTTGGKVRREKKGSATTTAFSALLEKYVRISEKPTNCVCIVSLNNSDRGLCNYLATRLGQYGPLVATPEILDHHARLRERALLAWANDIRITHQAIAAVIYFELTSLHHSFVFHFV